MSKQIDDADADDDIDAEIENFHQTGKLLHEKMKNSLKVPAIATVT